MYQVIIAEDEFFVRLGIKNSVSWEKYNMQVVCDAGNGAEALRAIQKSCPDVLITDLLMPGMGGQQLIESVRDAGLEPYIIVITCLEEFKTLQKMMSLGVRDYLLKATMTEAEIQASLQKAREALDKQARQLEPARAPVGNRFSQQPAYRCFQRLRQGDQQVGIRDGTSLLPFGDGLPHHIQLDGKLLLGEAL